MCASKTEIPKSYLERMRLWLGDEFESFLSAYQQEPIAGLRVNTLKISAEEFQRLSPFQLQPIEWCAEGFIISSEGKPGKHAYHSAGLYYLQEPSAMAAVELLDPQPGERILDLAAAPGGKATQIASRMENRGLFVANEIHPRRVWELAQNLERWGTKNTIILNESPQRLADHWGAYFDRVLLDAPCSGEGLFRRSEPARLEWSLESVQACALRQSGLLPQAARLVRPGGRLVYATCTFSLEENEQVIWNFLKDHPEFELVEAKSFSSFDQGWWNFLPDLPDHFSPKGVYRLLPHRLAGEGHCIAVLRRRTGGEWIELSPYRVNPLPKAVSGWLQEMLKQTINIDFDGLRLSLEGKSIYHIPPGISHLHGLRCIRPGWMIGEVKKDRVEPTHALALGLKGEEIQRTLSFPADSPVLTAYLRGESLRSESLSQDQIHITEQEGWLGICVDRFPLGWARTSRKVIKNAYPRGLRWM